jgi:AcrR family transcriptional regulator
MSVAVEAVEAVGGRGEPVGGRGGTPTDGAALAAGPVVDGAGDAAGSADLPQPAAVSARANAPTATIDRNPIPASTHGPRPPFRSGSEVGRYGGWTPYTNEGVEMGTRARVAAQPRAPLSTERVLRAAVAMADEGGADAVSMRKIAQALGVVPMALYKHVANKDDLLDGMIDLVVGEIDPPARGPGWKTVIRQRILSARRMLLRHPWASAVIESRAKARTTPTPVLMEYLESMVAVLRAGGLSIDLVHHAMHVMGSRMLGFSQDLFTDSAAGEPDPNAVAPEQMVARYPHLAELAMAVMHDPDSTVGTGCDDQFEFEFALDLMLDGLERLAARA